MLKSDDKHSSGPSWWAKLLIVITAVIGLLLGAAALLPSWFPRPSLPSYSSQLLSFEAAYSLERAVDSSRVVGLCYNGSAVLEGLPRHVCRRDNCLWSDAAAANIDLYVHPLAKMSAGGPCRRPAGGQRALREGQEPLISFVMPMQNRAHMTAWSLLEVFRTAHEVESAEFIVVDDGSRENVRPLREVGLLVQHTYSACLNGSPRWCCAQPGTHGTSTAALTRLWTPCLQAGQRLRLLFGTEFVYIRNTIAMGFGGAATKGISAARGSFVALLNNDMWVAGASMLRALALMWLRDSFDSAAFFLAHTCCQSRRRSCCCCQCRRCCVWTTYHSPNLVGLSCGSGLLSRAGWRPSWPHLSSGPTQAWSARCTLAPTPWCRWDACGRLSCTRSRLPVPPHF